MPNISYTTHGRKGDPVIRSGVNHHTRTQGRNTIRGLAQNHSDRYLHNPKATAPTTNTLNHNLKPAQKTEAELNKIKQQTLLAKSHAQKGHKTLFQDYSGILNSSINAQTSQYNKLMYVNRLATQISKKPHPTKKEIQTLSAEYVSLTRKQTAIDKQAKAFGTDPFFLLKSTDDTNHYYSILHTKYKIYNHTKDQYAKEMFFLDDTITSIQQKAKRNPVDTGGRPIKKKDHGTQSDAPDPNFPTGSKTNPKGYTTKPTQKGVVAEHSYLESESVKRLQMTSYTNHANINSLFSTFYTKVMKTEKQEGQVSAQTNAIWYKRYAEELEQIKGRADSVAYWDKSTKYRDPKGRITKLDKFTINNYQSAKALLNSKAQHYHTLANKKPHLTKFKRGTDPTKTQLEKTHGKKLHYPDETIKHAKDPRNPKYNSKVEYLYDDDYIYRTLDKAGEVGYTALGGYLGYKGLPNFIDWSADNVGMKSVAQHRADINQEIEEAESVVAFQRTQGRLGITENQLADMRGLAQNRAYVRGVRSRATGRTMAKGVEGDANAIFQQELDRVNREHTIAYMNRVRAGNQVWSASAQLQALKEPEEVERVVRKGTAVMGGISGMWNAQKTYDSLVRPLVKVGYDTMFGETTDMTKEESVPEIKKDRTINVNVSHEGVGEDNQRPKRIMRNIKYERARPPPHRRFKEMKGTNNLTFDELVYIQGGKNRLEKCRDKGYFITKDIFSWNEGWVEKDNIKTYCRDKENFDNEVKSYNNNYNLIK